MRKTLYFDINTEAKVKKIKNKLKHKVTESQIARKAISLTSFEEMVEALNIDMQNTKHIQIKNKHERP